MARSYWYQQGLTPPLTCAASSHCLPVESSGVVALIQRNATHREPWLCCRLASQACESC